MHKLMPPLPTLKSHLHLTTACPILPAIKAAEGRAIDFLDILISQLAVGKHGKMQSPKSLLRDTQKEMG